MMKDTLFPVNYLYDLPEELQTLIYRKLFKETLGAIDDMRETLDNYNKLIEYILKNNKSYNDYNDQNKNRAIWNIFLCSRRDAGDPYCKYFQYYTDNTTDVLRLNKTKMIRYNSAYSRIRYMDFSIYPLDIKVSDNSYMDMKKILDAYALIFLGYDADNANEYKHIQGLQLLTDKIRIEYKSGEIFRCTIDIYNNILDTYNFITRIFDMLNTYNHLYPAYDLEYMNDIIDLRNWFEYNSFFHGFTIATEPAKPTEPVNADIADIVRPRFYS
jgi:hypothetical protein